MIIGIMVCCICDIAISGTLTWSLIVLSSILVTWITSFPVILLGKRGVLVAMIAISIIIVPFMYILSILIKVNEVFSIGAIMSIISLAFLWIIYALYYRLKERKFLATGITFLFAIPFTLLINSISRPTRARRLSCPRSKHKQKQHNESIKNAHLEKSRWAFFRVRGFA